MNVMDYCKWRGDLSFKNNPFNEIDNMCFAQISYVEMDEFFKKKKALTLKELCDAYFKKHSIDEIENSKTFFKMSPYLLKQMAETERFSSCLIHDYVSILHNDSSEQFAAMIFDLDDGSSVIAFRGTDDSLIGWKEDLMLSYGDISSQFDALDYVNQNCKIFRKYRIVGHSKGGYLAIYAAVHANKLVRSNIIEVYSDDGPGLMEGSYNNDDLAFLEKKYKLIVPEKDGVGTIYEMSKNKKICKTDAFNIINAHSIFSWQVEGKQLVEADKYKYESDLSRKVILDILKETSKQQRHIFVEELFDNLAENNISTISDFSNGGFSIIYDTLKKLMSDMDDESKDVGIKMMKIISRNISSDIQQALSDANKVVKEKVADFGNSAENIIKEYFPKKKSD